MQFIVFQVTSILVKSWLIRYSSMKIFFACSGLYILNTYSSVARSTRGLGSCSFKISCLQQDTEAVILGRETLLPLWTQKTEIKIPSLSAQLIKSVQVKTGWVIDVFLLKARFTQNSVVQKLTYFLVPKESWLHTWSVYCALRDSWLYRSSQ